MWFNFFLALEKKCTVVWSQSLQTSTEVKDSIHTYKISLQIFFFGNFIFVTRFILLPLSQPLKKFTIIYIEISSKCLRIVIVLWDMYRWPIQCMYRWVSLPHTVCCWNMAFSGKCICGQRWQYCLEIQGLHILGNHIQSWSRMWPGIFTKVI